MTTIGERILPAAPTRIEGIIGDHVGRKVHDDSGDDSNGGLASSSDNGCDAREEAHIAGRDSCRVVIGNEATRYGDFVSTVKELNFETPAARESAAYSADRPKGNR